MKGKKRLCSGFFRIGRICWYQPTDLMRSANWLKWANIWRTRRAVVVGGKKKSFNDDIIRVFVVWFIILPRRSSRGFLFSAHPFSSALAFYLQKHPKSAWSEPLRTHRNQNPWISLVITVCLKKGRTAQNSHSEPLRCKYPTNDLHILRVM